MSVQQARLLFHSVSSDLLFSIIMSDDGYAFVCVDENVKEDGVELPAEENGTILLSVLQSQFNGASGLKYR